MSRKPNDNNKFAGEKRDLARRARRLAQTQVNDADRERLTRFAADLEKEAEELERLAGEVLPLPDPVATQKLQHQQVQQQQSAAKPGDEEEDKGLA